MLNSSGESGHPCLLPDLTGNAFSFSSLSLMFAVGYHISEISIMPVHLKEREKIWQLQRLMPG